MKLTSALAVVLPLLAARAIAAPALPVEARGQLDADIVYTQDLCRGTIRQCGRAAEPEIAATAAVEKRDWCSLHPKTCARAAEVKAAVVAKRQDWCNGHPKLCFFGKSE